MFNYCHTVRVEPPTTDPIYIVCQFYIDKIEGRHRENVFCLQKNVENRHISRIILLNERIYSAAELGVSDPGEKIHQIDLGKRILYSDIFAYTRESNLRGYVVFANSDIFLDDSIQHVRSTDIHLNRRMYALLRYEYIADDIEPRLFGPRYDSQDTWIFHSSQIISRSQEIAFRFAFGKPGCDNRIVYLMGILGYDVINDPVFIRTYHYHTSQARNYNLTDRISPPYGMAVPTRIPPNLISASFGLMPTDHIFHSTSGFSRFQENDHRMLRGFVADKLASREAFYIPQLVKVEYDLADVAAADCVAVHEPYSAELTRSSAETRQRYYLRLEKKLAVWLGAFNVFHYLQGSSEPWTRALRGKRVLIVSPYAHILEGQFNKTNILYNVDLFPDCTLVALKYSLDALYKIRGKFDVALVHAPDNSNQLSQAIFSKLHISAINVGPRLSEYFGVFSPAFMRDFPDVMRIYMNANWINLVKLL